MNHRTLAPGRPPTLLPDLPVVSRGHRQPRARQCARAAVRRAGRLERSLALACLLALFPLAARAGTNLIANPHFDDGIAGWSSPSYALSGGALDENGKMDGGSLRVSGYVEDSIGVVVSECFPVDPAATLVFGVSAFSPDSAAYVTRALLRVHDQPACAGSSVQLAPDLVTYLGADTWGPVQGHGQVPASAKTARLVLQVGTVGPPPAEVLFDNAFVYQDATCAATPTVACLNEGRFRFVARWETPDGMRGSALAKAFAMASDSAYATFFSPSNVELVVKVLNGCGVNERFWLFASGLTDVEAVLTVKDTLQGAEWSWINPQNEIFQPILDTSAFATCPH